MDLVDDIAHGAHGFELSRRDAPPGIFLQLHHQVDGIDAVEVEIVEQQRLARDLRLRHLEHLVQIGPQRREDFLLRGHHASPFCAAMNRAMVRMPLKILRVSSFTDSILILYALRIAIPSSSPSIESSPRPSPNRASSLPICSGVMSSKLSAVTTSSLSWRSRSSNLSMLQLAIVIRFEMRHQTAGRQRPRPTV